MRTPARTLRRLPGSLTHRQAAGLAAVASLAAVTVAAGFSGYLGVAVAALGLVSVLLFAATLRAHRQAAQARRGVRQLAELVRSGQQRCEVTGRQLLDAVVRERRAAAGRHRELAHRVAAGQQATDAALRRVSGHLVRRQRDQTRELEALVQLFHGFQPRAPMPSSGHWALNPTDLLELWSVVQRCQPKLVLELGSGASSTWLGYALERHHGRLVSVEHEPAYAAQTRASVRRHGLAGTVEVRDAPLRPIQVDDGQYEWYDPAAFQDLSGVDLLVVDGPPGGTGPQARYPALPVLAGRLAPGATVVLDDADRSDEQEILRRWTGSAPELVQEPGTVGQLAVLTYQAERR